MIGERFLTAEWRHLAMLNYSIDPAILRDRVPRGTTLDSFEGRTLVSVVGFHFVRTRVLGWPLPPGSEEEFITEHFWGYARQRDGGTVEYRVEHPSWRVRGVSEARLDCDVAGIYGGEFVECLSSSPVSAFLAEGSPVIVSKGR